VEDELDELLVARLAEELDERLGCERLAQLDRSQAILGEAIVEVIPDCNQQAASARGKAKCQSELADAYCPVR